MGTPDAVHDLRVAIRRLNQCLRLFRDFFPPGEARSIRRQLRKLMDLAGDVRNYDIAVELVKKSKTPVIPELATERRRARRKLVNALNAWSRRDSSQKWRERLNA